MQTHVFLQQSPVLGQGHQLQQQQLPTTAAVPGYQQKSLESGEENGFIAW